MSTDPSTAAADPAAAAAAAAAQAAFMAQLGKWPPKCTPFPIQSKEAAFLAVNTIFAAVAITFVGLRWYVRVRGPGVGWDDVFITVATTTGFMFYIIQIMLSHCGMGQDMTVALIDVPFMLINVFIAQFAGITGSCFVKLAMLAFYLRVFSTNLLRKLVWITAGLTVAQWISFVFVTIFTCHPISSQWNITITEKQCIQQNPYLMGAIYSNVIMDLIVMVLPISTIWGLQMKLSDKMGVLACVTLNLLSQVVAIVRGSYITGVDLQSNLTGSIGPSVFMAVLDAFMQVICVTIPTLRPLWRRLRGHESTLNPKSGVTAGSSRNTASRTGRATAASKNRTLNETVNDNGKGYVEMDVIENDNFPDDGSEKDLTSKQAIHAKTTWSVA